MVIKYFKALRYLTTPMRLDDLMEHIAFFARNVFDPSKPIFLYRLQFSNVTSKTEWMNRTVENIGLPKYPWSIEELLVFDNPNTFNFVRVMDIDAINSETINIHFTARQF